MNSCRWSGQCLPHLAQGTLVPENKQRKEETNGYLWLLLNNVIFQLWLKCWKVLKKKTENAVQKQKQTKTPSEHHPLTSKLFAGLGSDSSLKGRDWGRNNYFWEGIIEDQKKIILLSFWFICFVHICNSCFYIGIIHFKITWRVCYFLACYCISASYWAGHWRWQWV